MDKIPDAVVEAMCHEADCETTAMHFALKAAEAAGWTMVPKEPTEGMKTKGRFQLKIEQIPRTTYDDWAAKIYRAMIAAAPKVD